MKYFVSFSIFFVLTACSISKKDNQVNNPSLELTKEVENTKPVYPSTRPLYQASETKKTQLIHTKLEVRFDWTKSWMYGNAEITARPYFYASDSLILDAKGMQINTVKVNGKELVFAYANDVLRIKLDKTYTRKEKYTVSISYIAKPDERKTSGSAAITSDKGLYFINPTGEDKSKMPQIWTQGETESSSVWFPTIDSPNAKTSQEIYITVEDKYVTLSNGKLMKSTKNADGTRTDYWKQELVHAPYLFMMGIGEFKIVKDSYTRPDGTKMEVNYYVEPEWEPYAKAIFGETPEMIRYFSKLMGVEYPWDKYNQIVVREYVSGAMENTGAVVFGDYAYKDTRALLDENDQSTIAHELFHHWFGDLVTAESWSNLTLNESFANYSQYLWDEHRYGLDEADFQAEQEAAGYFNSAANSGYHNLVWFDYDDKEQMFDGHSYNKGGRILHMLRNYLGDEAFFAALNLYLESNKFKAAEFTQLRLAFEEVSGEDLNWFFNQWYLDDGHPILNIEQYYSAVNKEVVLTVSQIQDLGKFPLFKLPLQVAVFDDGGKHIYPAELNKQTNKLVFPVQGKLKTVIFDYQQMLLAEITYEKSQAEYVQQYYLGERFVARRDALLYGTVTDSPESHAMIADALNDPFWNVRETAIEKAVFVKGEKKADVLAKIKEMASSDPKSAVRVAALNYLTEELEPAQYERLLFDRIEKDSSYQVVGFALARLGSLNPEKAMPIAKTMETSASSKIKSGVAQLYATQGKEANFAFFEKLLNENKLTGYDGIYALNSFSLYVARMSDETQAKALAIYKIQQEKGGYYTKMFMPQNVQYLKNTVSDRIAKSKAEIEAYEKNKDVALADQARKKLKLQVETEKGLAQFLAEIKK